MQRVLVRSAGSAGPEVEVVAFRLERRPGDLAALDDAERERAERFVFALHRDRFIAGRAMLRGVLGDRLGRQGRSLEMVSGPAGKPALADGAIEFNLSHTEDRAVLALGPPGRALGVDIEAQRPLSNRAALAAVSFAPQERVDVEAEVDPDAAFYRVWSRKEAVIKALGAGVGYGLTRFRVSAGVRAQLLGFVDPRERLDAWTLESLDLGAEVAAALATRVLDTPGGLT